MDNKAKHTAGPWEVEGATLIWSPSTTANVAAVSALRDTGFVGYTRPSIDDMDFAEIAANARLIAAAPELLDSVAALQFIVKALANELGIDPERTEFRFSANKQPIATVNLADVYERTDAVISKATGDAA